MQKQGLLLDAQLLYYPYLHITIQQSFNTKLSEQEEEGEEDEEEVKKKGVCGVWQQQQQQWYCNKYIHTRQQNVSDAGKVWNRAQRQIKEAVTLMEAKQVIKTYCKTLPI